MIRTGRTALAQSVKRFSEKIMLKKESRTTKAPTQAARAPFLFPA